MVQDEQLLKDYSIQEKKAYLGIIASIATADRQATDDELEFFEALVESAELPAADAQDVLRSAQDPNNADLLHHLAVLKNSPLRFSLLADIISFAKADGQYTPEEQKQINAIASHLNIDQKQIHAVNQFVDSASQAQSQGTDITQSNFLSSSGLGSTLQKAGISPDMIKGALAVMAPILISRMMRGNRSSYGRMGAPRGGGLLGGLLGGMAGSMMGGAMGRSGMSGRSTGMGGLGSIFSTLGGNRRYGNYGGSSGGLGSLLGGLLGGRRGGMF